MLSQKEAVYEATVQVMKQAQLAFDGRSVSQIIPKELRRLVTQELVQMFKNGQVGLKATASNSLKTKDEARLAAYASGLISNHWKRDARLNGKV